MMFHRSSFKSLIPGNWLSCLMVAVLIAILFRSSSAGIYIVTNTGDSGAGSFRQAITDANGSAGVDTIAFNIPGAGPHTIQPLSSLPTLTDTVIIDGYTEPEAFPATSTAPAVLMIELDGGLAGSDVDGLTFVAGQNTLRGLAIIHFDRHGVLVQINGGNVIEGNHLGANAAGFGDPYNGGHGILVETPDNTIGGTTAGARNVVSGNNLNGIVISGPTACRNVVQGNYVGPNSDGSPGLGNQTGISIWQAPQNTIGGTIPGAGNVSSGNFGGICISGTAAHGNVVQGNFVGTDVTGASGVGQQYGGVCLTNAPNNTIGGTDPGARNVISENSWGGLVILGSASTGNLVQGNYIGTDVTGTVAISNYPYGIWIYDDASSNTIGGATTESGNLIAYNDYSGVCIESGSGNSIMTNAIFSNGELGIDLEDDGVTLNDAGDTDAGANGLQNFPVLTTAIIGGGITTVLGTLNSTANTSFILRFFHNGAYESSGHGEGEVFVGETVVTTDGSGNVSFTEVFGAAVPEGNYISATATSEAGNTSEFSKLLMVGLSIQRSNGAVLLSWTGTFGAAEYWLYGAMNECYFSPGLAPDYEHRLDVLSSDTYSWSTSNGVGNDLENWTYLVIAVDSGGQEIGRTNRAGEWDYIRTSR